MLHGRPEMMPERQPAESTACASSPLSTSAPLRLRSQWGALAPSVSRRLSLPTHLPTLSVLDEPTVLRCGSARCCAFGWCATARTRKRDGTGCEVLRMHIKWAQPEAERARSSAMPVARAELHTFLVVVAKAETVAEPRSRVFVCRATDVQLGPADRKLSAIGNRQLGSKLGRSRARAGGFHSTATSAASAHWPA